MHLKHKTRWKGLLGAVKMYHFNYHQDTSLVRKYFWKEPLEWDESREIRAKMPAPPSPTGGPVE